MRMPVDRFTAVTVSIGTNARKPCGPPSSSSSPNTYFMIISAQSSSSSTPVMTEATW